MGQEFFVNSQNLENKVRELLPSQGGSGAGFDLSASTQIIPVIDLTESAEGSNIREDLQTAISFNTATAFQVSNSTVSVITNTGYFRIFGSNSIKTRASTQDSASLIINDGATDKTIQFFFSANGQDNNYLINTFDFNIFLEAGHSFIITATANAVCTGSFRQIASIDGTLTNP